MADRLKFGPGAVRELPAEIERLGGGTVLIVTDEGVRDAGIVDTAVETFPADLRYEIFDDVEPDPSAALFDRAARYADEVDPDVVVGIGGGSAIDVDKGASLLSTHGGAVLDYVAQPTGEGQPIPGPPHRVVIRRGLVTGDTRVVGVTAGKPQCDHVDLVVPVGTPRLGVDVDPAERYRKPGIGGRRVRGQARHPSRCFRSVMSRIGPTISRGVYPRMSAFESPVTPGWA